MKSGNGDPHVASLLVSVAPTVRLIICAVNSPNPALFRYSIELNLERQTSGARVSLDPRFSSAQQAMIHEIAIHGPMSRTRLARALGLGKPALTALARSLLESHVVVERQEASDGRQGRPSLLLGMNPGYGFFAGTALIHDHPALVLTDLAGHIVARTDLVHSADPQIVADAIASGLDRLRTSLDIAPNKILGLGIAISGLVDARNETCLASAMLGWHDIPLAPLVHERTGLPTVLENDAKTAAMRENLFGLARQLRDFAVITLGENIGSASYFDGRLRRGHHGGAGEIAHITIDPSGPPCNCGKRGCLDVTAGRRAVLERARAAGLAATAIADLEREAGRGNPVALDLLHRSGTAMGTTIAQIIQICDPEAVILVDTASALGPLLRTVITKTVQAGVLPDLARDLRLEFCTVTDDYWPQAAASVAAHNFFVAG
jgi:predicted NBD/HSP70 family sugar kinase